MLDEGDEPVTKGIDSLMQEEQPVELSSKTALEASWERHADTPRQNLVSQITARDSEATKRDELFDYIIRYFLKKYRLFFQVPDNFQIGFG